MNSKHTLSSVLLCSALSLANCAPAARAGDAPAEPLPVTVFKNLQAGKKQTVIAYGTSLTEHGEWTRALNEYFDQQFPGQVTFLNRGGSGETSVWGVTNLPARVLANHPDLVFLEFSVNDAAARHNISTAQSAANLDHMISALRQQNPHVDIVVQTMNPAWDSPAEPSHKKYATDRPHLEEYYDTYRQYAHEHSLPLVDNYPNWKKLEQEDEAKFKQWLPEGLHPLPEASRAVTWPAIRTLLEQARSAAAAH